MTSSAVAVPDQWRTYSPYPIGTVSYGKGEAKTDVVETPGNRIHLFVERNEHHSLLEVYMRAMDEVGPAPAAEAA